MARKGVFSRNDDTPESIPRSLQLLSHRHGTVAKYMEIYPNFCEVLSPNESIKLNVTNFVRSIPMNTPQLSRVRLVQRFYAVPFRIMWQPWEDWIKGEDDSQFRFELPYPVNNVGADDNELHNALVARDSRTSYGSSRRIELDSTTGYVKNIPANSNFKTASLIIGLRELGDYLRYPIFSVMGLSGTDATHTTPKYLVPHAFKMCAYQLCYSYGYRKPNVQARIDDFRELYVNQLDQQPTAPSVPDYDKFSGNQSYEYPPFISEYDITNNKMVPVDVLTPSISGTKAGLELSSTKEDIIRTSWDKVEHFPLKAGANLSLLARDVDSNGMPVYKSSNIALFRMRFANWQDDYFTTSNPWQQRGDEAQIPVVGNVQVDLSGVTLSISSSATSTFTGTESTANVSKFQLRDPYTGNWINHDLIGTSDSSGKVTLGDVDTGLAVANTSARIPVTVTPAGTVATTVNSTGTFSGATGSVSGLYVSPSAFRFAMALQHVKELQAQTDNRYKSYMRKIFGASIPDNRIDRPDFLGGSVQEINVSDVIQSTQGNSTPDNTLGTLGGRASSAKTSKTISFYAHEHTVVIGLLHIIPDTLYLNGLAREDNVHDRFDFIMPQFSRLSEQPVYNYELATVGFTDLSTFPANDFNVFGYEPVYNYERWRKSMATGDFRDFVNSKGSSEWYKPWLVTRDFGFKVTFDAQTSKTTFDYVQPTLSDKFLSGRYGVDYSNFVVTNPKLMYPFIVDSYFELRWTRIIPTRGNPAKLG